MLLFLNRARAVFMALSVHVIFAVILLYGLNWSGWEEPKRPEIMPAIQATVVDVSELVRSKKTREQEIAREQARQRLIEQNRRAEAARQEQERQAEMRRQQAQEDMERQQRADEAKRQADARAAAQAKAVADAAEAQRKLDELEREIQLAEARRIELEERVAKQQEDQRERDAKRLADAEAAERDRQAALEASELAAAQNITLRDEYIATIKAVVTGNWLRPPSARSGLSCKIAVQQIPGGEVIDARVVSPCNADEATRRSIVQAVMRSQPLPSRGFEKVFEARITFDFVYDG